MHRPEVSFEKALSDALDKSLLELDENQLSQLAQRRQQALRIKPTPIFYKYSAIAASIVAVVFLSWLVVPDIEPDIATNYHELDPVFLETIDMLAVIGEPLDAT